MAPVSKLSSVQSSDHGSDYSAPPSPRSSVSSADGFDDDVAIIGMACRTAGGNDTPDKLWRFLMNKEDGSGVSPAWRWEPWIKRDPRNAKAIEKTPSKGYFIEDLEYFDAAFFGISPKEAEQMDPHQRMGLEVTWEALENAGLSPHSLRKSDTAVYMGVDSDDYSRLLLEDIPNIEAWMGIGTTAHGIPNRISYHLDFMGPSVAVDAACASSLCAVHLGRQAVVTGESRVAIVGGVNVCLSPALFHMLGSAGALSPDGVCSSFDDNANGYARGEGAAVLILKRVSHAIMDGDRILATLKGSAIAQDGKTNGIMAPNSKAQELVARKALSTANIDPLSVRYVEAHATSTSLGDPTEVSAIAAVYGAGRPQNEPAYLGSIKPNIGHLEAAAGAISLVKAVLAVNQGEIPPQARLNKLNSKIAWEKSGLQVVRERTSWKEAEGPRRAAICSYGYGGTVSHVVIEESPASVPVQDVKRGPVLLLLSAPQEKRLTLQSAAQAEWLSVEGKSEDLKAIGSTLARRRAHHTFRAAAVINSHEEAVEAWNSLSKGISNDWTSQGRVLENNTSKDVVWVFSGHGAQWTDMGKELLSDPNFHQALVPLDNIVHRELGWSAIEKLKSGDFKDSDEIQVLTYLIQVGLTRVLQSKGIRPQAVIGHSVGEIAASVAAESLTPEEGAIIVTRRARLYAQVRGSGGMYLVNLPFREVAAELGERKDLVPAIQSSPSSCVISGTTEPLSTYVEGLKKRGAKVFEVKTDIPFHSPILEALSAPLRDELSSVLEPRKPTVKLYSTSQTDSRSEAVRDAEYWVNNMVKPVWLNSAVEAAAEDGYRLFLEISSHPIVSHSVNETLGEKGLKEYAIIPSMKKNKSADQSLLHALAQLYVYGADIDFAALFGRHWCDKVPGFQWSKKAFWKDVTTSAFDADSVHDPEKHTMLGQRTFIAGSDTILYSTKLEENNKPFPRPHELHGTNIIPAAVYVNTFLHGTGANMLSDMIMSVPLAITEDRRLVQVLVEGQNVKVASRLESSGDQSWITHSNAQWSIEAQPQNALPVDVEAIKTRIGTILPKDFSINHLTKVGVSGIAFPWAVTEHYGNSLEMMARVDADPSTDTVTWDRSSWAAILDAASSVGATVFFGDAKLRIVSKIRKVIIHSDLPPKICYLHVSHDDVAPDNVASRAAKVSVMDVHGELLAELQGLTLTEVDGGSKKNQGMTGLVHRMAWVPARLTEQPFAFEQVILISEHNEVLERYSDELKGRPFEVVKLNLASQLQKEDTIEKMSGKTSAVVYCPGPPQLSEDIANTAQKLIWEVITAVKHIFHAKLPAKFFCITDRVFAGESSTALAQGSLYGLARVIAVEHSDIWGGLIDIDGPNFPILPIKYVQGRDVIRCLDGVPRVARMRPFTKDHLIPSSVRKTLLPRPEGTYIITGGLGFLGLETCDFLIAKGARRIVIISRRALPPRSRWATASSDMAPILTRIQAMESHGASINVISLDMGAEDAHEQILSFLDRLSLPPVLGVIHASGVLEGSLMLDITPEVMNRVLSPKISGALALHRAFPVASNLDFFILFSSIGQLVGTPGQSAYAPSNAFLDTLAIHRRQQGDNAIAFQWTAWRGAGMGQSDHLDFELQSAGITDITLDEGFRAWEHMSKYESDHAAVVRSIELDADEPVPCALFEEVAPRRPRAEAVAAVSGVEVKADANQRPTNPVELKGWLNTKVRECIGSALKISEIEDLDDRVAVTDLGVDSVMTLVLCQKLQSVLKIKVPQTLVWNHPTIVAMVEWFVKQLQGDGL